MATYYEQACPLCEATATYGWVDYANRKYFRCPHCGAFQISRRAEAVLDTRLASRKAHYAAQAAAAPENQMLVIRMPEASFREAGADELQATFVDKAELPLDCA